MIKVCLPAQHLTMRKYTYTRRNQNIVPYDDMLRAVRRYSAATEITNTLSIQSKVVLATSWAATELRRIP